MLMTEINRTDPALSPLERAKQEAAWHTTRCIQVCQQLCGQQAREAGNDPTVCASFDYITKQFNDEFSFGRPITKPDMARRALNYAFNDELEGGSEL